MKIRSNSKSARFVETPCNQPLQSERPQDSFSTCLLIAPIDAANP